MWSWLWENDMMHVQCTYIVINLNLSHSDLELDNESDDIYSLGIHIMIDHKLSEKGDFDKFYRVLILSSNSSPSSQEVKKHKFIHRLNSLRPSGINRANPFTKRIGSINSTRPKRIKSVNKFMLFDFQARWKSNICIFIKNQKVWLCG